MTESFFDAIDRYTEPGTRMVGLWPKPKDGSTENGLLFTATAVALALVRREDATQTQALAERFAMMVWRCEIRPGCPGRWPISMKASEPTAWDDLVAIAAVGRIMKAAYPNDLAERVADYGIRHDWCWGTNWWARILDFVPAVKAAAGYRLGDISELMAALGFIANLWEPKQETSGKCLLYLKALLYERVGAGAWLKFAIALWKRRITRDYGGMAGVYAVYFNHPDGIPNDHPFIRFPPPGFVS